MDDERCFKIQNTASTNDGIALLCHQDGSELLQVESTEEDDFITDILDANEYANPTHPGMYHIGTYQQQSAGQYYHRNGARV